MHFPFQLRSITSSCPSGAFFRYSHFWLLYGFRIGSDRARQKAESPIKSPLPSALYVQASEEEIDNVEGFFVL